MRPARWSGADPRPFADVPAVAVVPPEARGPDAAAIASFVHLLRNETAELAVELGAGVDVVPAGAQLTGHRVLIGPARHNATLRAMLAALGEGLATSSRLALRRHPATGDRILVLDGPDVGEVGAALNLLRTATRDRLSELTPAAARRVDEVMRRVEREVASTWPSFPLRGVDWTDLCARAHEDVLARGADVRSLQRWLAPLRDPHTWVKGPEMNGRLPYQLWAAGARATLTAVPRWSAAWDAGVRPGDELLDVDVPAWWARTPAEPRVKPRYAGYRILSGPAGEPRVLRARAASGEIREWREAPTATPWDEIVTWRRTPNGAGELRINGWHDSGPFHDAIDAAFADFAHLDRLIVDVRGNPGGNLVAAQAFRDRFLRGRTHLGTIRFSRGDGTLAPAAPLVAEPAASRRRWTKPVRFLTDALSYSATEDALLGLHGLGHVQIAGEPSGGGSGRPRSILLWPDVTLTVSTALTYDRAGRCIEGNGIPVDLPVPFAMPGPDGEDRALRIVDECW